MAYQPDGSIGAGAVAVDDESAYLVVEALIPRMALSGRANDARVTVIQNVIQRPITTTVREMAPEKKRGTIWWEHRCDSILVRYVIWLFKSRIVAEPLTLTGVDGSIAGGVLVPSDVSQGLTSTELASDLETHLTSVAALAQRNRKRGPGLQAYYLSPKMSSNTLDLCSSSLGGYGKYTEIATVSRVEDDGNASYDYWSARIQQQTLGGYGHCGTDYRTNALATTVDMKRVIYYLPKQTVAQATPSLDEVSA